MAGNTAPKSAKIYASLGIASVILGLGATLYFAFLRPTGEDQYAMCRDTKIAGGANVIGGPFTLTDENGARVTDKDVITGPTLVYFGYSYCPDVCPLDGVRNAEATTLLREAGEDVGSLFITVDPERDTPEVMKEFTSYFDDDMIGLTGSQEDVTAAAKEYRVYFAKNGDGEDYLMDHSTFTYLMMPETGLAEIIRRDWPAEKVAETVGCFIEHS